MINPEQIYLLYINNISGSLLLFQGHCCYFLYFARSDAINSRIGLNQEESISVFLTLLFRTGAFLSQSGAAFDQVCWPIGTGPSWLWFRPKGELGSDVTSYFNYIHLLSQSGLTYQYKWYISGALLLFLYFCKVWCHQLGSDVTSIYISYISLLSQA